MRSVRTNVSSCRSKHVALNRVTYANFSSEPRATLASLDDSHSFGRKSCHASRKTSTAIHDVHTKVSFEENDSKKFI